MNALKVCFPCYIFFVNYLGIDFGERRVGIAFADSETRMAFPRETIDCKTQDLWERLKAIVEMNRVEALVVGMPYHPDGRENGKNKTVEIFLGELTREFPNLLIFTQDEAYTSSAALQQTSYLSKKKKKNKGIIDQTAAAIILQSWLDDPKNFSN